MLLNTDATIAPDWTEKVVAFASRKPRGALYQGTTLDYYNHQVIDSTHIYVSHNGQGTQGNWRHFVGLEKGPKKVFGVNAAACLISRSFIEAQPFDTYFDEALFMYLEDVDVAARATVMGWDNYLVPGARAYHMGSVSSGKNPGFSLYMTFRNNSDVLFKNFPLGLLIRILPRLIRGDIDTIRELRRRGKPAAVRKVIKGRFVGLLRMPLFIAKRRKMNKARTIDANYLWSLMRNGY
jgi:GT2 family glycosyltransferase